MTDNNLCRFVSIIMPAFNEQSYIGEALLAVLNLDYPKDCYEIIVVDNGSSDDTVLIAKKFANQVHIVPNVRVGAVRNFGVRCAKGDIIAFLDSDCIPPVDWLGSTLNYMDQNSCDAVGGLGLVRDDPSWIESCWILNQMAVDKPSKILAGASIIMKKKVFWAVGGFNEEINAGEDTALANELISNGYVVHFAKSCAVVHLGYPRDIKTFITRQFWQASSYMRSKKKHGIDVIFYLVLSFLAAVMLTPIMFLFSYSAGFLGLFLLMTLPALLSLKRIVASRYFSHRLDSYLKIYFLDLCYLVGRAAGLGKSILAELKIITDKKNHY